MINSLGIRITRTFFIQFDGIVFDFKNIGDKWLRNFRKMEVYSGILNYDMADFVSFQAGSIVFENG